MKKIMAIMLALTMVLSLCACGNSQKALAKAVEKMDSVQNYKMDMDVDIQMKLMIMEQDLDMDITMKNTADVFTDPVKAKMDTNVTIMGEDLSGQYVFLKNDEDRFDLYSSEDGETWEKEVVDEDDLPMSADIQSEFKGLAEAVDSFEATGEEDLNGVKVVIYTGEISGEQLQQAAEAAGMSELLETDLGADVDEMDLSQVSSIPVTIAVDKETGYVVRYTMDMTAALNDIMGMIMQAEIDDAVAESQSEDGEVIDLDLDFKMEVGKANVVVNMHDFNAAEDFEIPSAK